NPSHPFPERRGTFLWASHHEIPQFKQIDQHTVLGTLSLPSGMLERKISFSPEKNSFTIEDSSPGVEPIATTWRFHPGAALSNAGLGQKKYLVKLFDSNLEITGTGVHFLYNPHEEVRGKIVYKRSDLGDVPLQSICSPAFR